MRSGVEIHSQGHPVGQIIRIQNKTGKKGERNVASVHVKIPDASEEMVEKEKDAKRPWSQTQPRPSPSWVWVSPSEELSQT